MAKGEETYDDSAFIYFALSVIVIILIPTSLGYLKKWRAAFGEPEKMDGKECHCERCKEKSENLLKGNRKPSRFAYFKFLLYVGIWALFFFLVYTAYSKQTEAVQVFNPYDILGLSEGASPEDIKAAFRKLSLKWHPDKNKAENAVQVYTGINKAYKTLTDPETREKWEKYGNPDGPQGFSMGIALPSFLVDAKNSTLVLGVYILFLVVVFPTIAICFWNSQKETAPNQLNRKTMGYYYQSLKQTHRFKYLIDILALSFEYVSLIPVRRSDEIDIAKLRDLIPSDDKKKSKKKDSNVHPLSIKNPFLFYVHFSRLGNQLSEGMKEDLGHLIGLAHRHIFGLVELSVARQMLVPTTEAIIIAQMVTQAVWPESLHVGKNTELLQIPYMTENSIARLSDKKWKMTFQQFIRADPEKRRMFLEEEKLNQEEIDDVERVIRSFPSDLSVELKVEVEDEDIVSANSVATLIATFSRPSKVTTVEKEKAEAIPVHAPFYPAPKTEGWWVIMGDERTGMILGIAKVPAMWDGAEAKIQFGTPRKAGQYPLTIYVMTDSYVGFDLKLVYKLDVAKEVQLKESLQDIQENPDDDSQLSGKEDEDSGDENASDEDSDDN